jgi:uncharacterized protein (DUF1330 family)
MKMKYAVALSLLTGFAIGAAAIDRLHGQPKPPVYIVGEIDVTNPEAYAKEFVPLAMAANKAGGIRYIALGGKVTPLDGEPPKSRVLIQQWDSLEQALAVRNSPQYKEARKIGDKYAKFRSYAVEGVAQ